MNRRGKAVAAATALQGAYNGRWRSKWVATTRFLCRGLLSHRGGNIRPCHTLVGYAHLSESFRRGKSPRHQRRVVATTSSSNTSRGLRRIKPEMFGEMKGPESRENLAHDLHRGNPLAPPFKTNYDLGVRAALLECGSSSYRFPPGVHTGRVQKRR
jgi:hypothetical protein